MKTNFIHRFASLSAAFALSALLLPASAGARGRSTTFLGARGGVYHREVTHQPGNFCATESVTLPRGRIASRSVQSTATTDGRTTQVQSTGFGGRTATYSSTRVDHASGYTRQVTATGRDGSSAAKTVDVSRQNGTTTRTVVTALASSHP